MRKKYPTHTDHCLECIYHKGKEDTQHKCKIIGKSIYMRDDADDVYTDISNPKYEVYNLEQGYKVKHFPDWCPLEDEEL